MVLHLDLTSLITGIVGFFIGLVFMWFFYAKSEKTLKEYKRKLEKTSINSTEESSKVAVLEAKIATLEKALQSAIENNND